MQVTAGNNEHSVSQYDANTVHHSRVVPLM